MEQRAPPFKSSLSLSYRVLLFHGCFFFCCCRQEKKIILMFGAGYIAE